MNYNWKAIGKRIRTERKNLSLSQEKLIEKTGLQVSARQTIGNWESGESEPDLYALSKLCEIFNCEMGYLLCEYDCKTREATDIQKVTGLSEKAIESLSGLKSSGNISILSQIVEHQDLGSFLDAVRAYGLTVEKNHYRTGLTDEEILLADYFNCEPTASNKYLEENSISVIKSAIMKIIEEIYKLEFNNKKPLQKSRGE